MTAIDEVVVRRLAAAVEGEVCRPGDPGYAQTCAVWNGLVARHPALVVRAAGATDVAEALRWAREAGLEVSVRGGGHGYAGHALSEGGLTIDVGAMRAITVEPGARFVTCGAGITWAELDAATQRHGLAVPGGFVSHTGVAGLTLGGGLGWLTRLAGLSCDNLVTAEVVTAGGQVLEASEDAYPDLFWGLRGGGGNFGVVTRFAFRAHPVGPEVHLGFFFVGLDQGAPLLRVARELVGGLPDDAGAFVGALSAPAAPFVPEHERGRPGYALVVAGYGDARTHRGVAARIRRAVAPVAALETSLPYVELQRLFDDAAPWGSCAYEKALHLDALSDDAITVILDHVPRRTSPMSFVGMFTLGGAFARVPDDAGAFGGRRSTRYVVNINALAPTAAAARADVGWVRSLWEALLPHADGSGSYVNFLNEPDHDRVRQAYGPKYERLAALKRVYDPDNVFHLNANIPPR